MRVNARWFGRDGEPVVPSDAVRGWRVHREGHKGARGSVVVDDDGTPLYLDVDVTPETLSEKLAPGTYVLIPVDNDGRAVGEHAEAVIRTGGARAEAATAPEAGALIALARSNAALAGALADVSRRQTEALVALASFDPVEGEENPAIAAAIEKAVDTFGPAVNDTIRPVGVALGERAARRIAAGPSNGKNGEHPE